MQSLVDNNIPPFRAGRVDTISGYFFFREKGKAGENFKPSDTTDAAQALSLILHQVLGKTRIEPAFLEVAKSAWEKHGIKLKDNFSAVWELLVDCGEKAPFFCLVDALDEFEVKLSNSADRIAPRLLQRPP
jgi:hypothetical protein